MSAEDAADDSPDACSSCGRPLTEGVCLTDGCRGHDPDADSDTSASALMGGDTAADAGDGDLGPTDPAREGNAYLERIQDEAERQHPDIDDGVRNRPDWDEMTEDERTNAVRERADEAPTSEPVSTTPDAPTDPEDVDWKAFAQEFNFHLAGRGCQNRHTNAKKLRIALETSDHVATTNPEAFLADAVACDDIPLVEDESLGYLFAEEVLADG